MCLIAFAIGVRADCPLLLASNRDEFFDRPTDALHRWADGSGIWAGRDRRDGGTWLGVSESGRVALLTNVRNTHHATGARSRGELVTGWLRADTNADRFAQDLDPQAYGGFNLVLGDLHQGRWTWLSNRDPQAPHGERATAWHQQDLAPGVYGLSNAALDTPWPKTRRIKAALSQALETAHRDASTWMPPLQRALSDTTLADDLPSTGVAPAWERVLSSPFVQAPEHGYGTRSSLVMRVLAAGAGRQIELHEWTHTRDGWSAEGPSRHQLDW